MLNLPSILRIAEYLPSTSSFYKKRLKRKLRFVQERGFTATITFNNVVFSLQ